MQTMKNGYHRHPHLFHKRPCDRSGMQQLDRMGKNWIHRLKDSALAYTLLALSIPAFATRQCPPEFGPKHPSVNALGWLVVGLGITLGVALLAYAITRSRGTRFLKRAAIIALAIVGMAVLVVGGLALAVGFFFLRC